MFLAVVGRSDDVSCTEQILIFRRQCVLCARNEVGEEEEKIDNNIISMVCTKNIRIRVIGLDLHRM